MKFAAALMLMLPLVTASRVPAAKADGDIWVVLVAGSNGWYNYRHQSDICHAYQILSKNGIPDDHIIVMMYDDIAFDSSNPTPGEIINHPSGGDVYANVPTDYTGSAVTVDTFFKVLRGDAEGLKGVGSGKVVNAGPNDRIFINMDDHGSPGLFCFPYDNMYAEDFANVVLEMKENNKFGEMMVYIESCYSGSMFQDLFPDDIGFYALSASSPYENSWATYCSGPLDTCLADLFSVGWMEDVEAKDPNTETLKENFEVTKIVTDMSDVMQWGQTSIEDQFVAAFMGSGAWKKTSPVKKSSPEELKASSVPIRDVPLITLKNRVTAAKDLKEKQKWTQEILSLKENRNFAKETMKKIATAVVGDEKLAEEMMVEKQAKITNWGCYKAAVEAFHSECFNLGQSNFALKFVPTLLNLCEAGYKSQDIVSAAKSLCKFPTMYNVV